MEVNIQLKIFKLFIQRVLNWFNQVNACKISPTTEETVFGITTAPVP